MPGYAGTSSFHFPAPLKCLSPLRCSPHFIFSSSSLLLYFSSHSLTFYLYIPLQSPLCLIYIQHITNMAAAAAASRACRIREYSLITTSMHYAINWRLTLDRQPGLIVRPSHIFYPMLYYYSNGTEHCKEQPSNKENQHLRHPRKIPSCYLRIPKTVSQTQPNKWHIPTY